MGTTVTDPLVGRLVDGRYEVVSRIARGGMATVYLAVDRRLDREVALKVMHPHLAEGASGADFVARFRREARTAARLAHPGLVSVFDQGVDGETSYLTMEYVDGTTLRRRLAERGSLSVGEALRVAESVLDALAAAHRAGLVHRDIKPENVLIDGDDRVKLGDFGLTRAVTEVTSTTTGTVLGTVAYLSPELVARGASDARTDVYACGILLFEMLTGRQPFSGSTPIQVAFQHVNSNVPAPSETVAWLPSEIDELVEALAARDPADRPVDAGSALALLRRTRAELDDETLRRRADVAPTATLPVATDPEPEDEEPSDRDHLATTPLTGLRGSTVALPIGLGLPAAATPTAPTRRRHRLRALLITLAVLAVVGGGGAWWYFASGPGAYTTVPAITGLSADEAEAALVDQGLEPQRHDEFDDTARAGEVFATDPEVGGKVRKGGTVSYTVSKGVDLVTMPEGVVGAMQADAEAALKAADLDVEYGPAQWHDTAPSGQVLTATLDGTEVTAGQEVKRGSTIVLVYSQGPAPVTVISLGGATVEEATAQLADLGLKLAVGSEEFSDDVPQGRIISQSPEAGTPGHRGDTVTVVVSKGVEMVPVPNVYKMKLDKAQKTLTDAGFQVNVVKLTFYLGWDEVANQDPAGGKDKTAPKGSVVTVYII